MGGRRYSNLDNYVDKSLRPADKYRRSTVVVKLSKNRVLSEQPGAQLASSTLVENNPYLSGLKPSFRNNNLLAQSYDSVDARQLTSLPEVSIRGSIKGSPTPIRPLNGHSTQ